MHRVSAGDSNSRPPDLELGALTKWLARRMPVSAGFSTVPKYLSKNYY
jgi:hypothetical protein